MNSVALNPDCALELPGKLLEDCPGWARPQRLWCSGLGRTRPGDPPSVCPSLRSYPGPDARTFLSFESYLSQGFGSGWEVLLEAHPGFPTRAACVISVSW